ncbi:hypothetical protein [Micromonospora sediminicola]|uniref:hypothetical protein n=1 Tax=Micromonospora sediminicola TaxID=946078 RepID=UPI0037923318
MGVVAEAGAWLELARRVTAAEREHRGKAADCWNAHDYNSAIRLRGIADGLAMALDLHLLVVAESRGESRG